MLPDFSFLLTMVRHSLCQVNFHFTNFNVVDLLFMLMSHICLLWGIKNSIPFYFHFFKFIFLIDTQSNLILNNIFS